LSIARALEGNQLSLGMVNIDSNHENKCLPSRQVGHDGVIVIAIVGYWNADDVATCVAALSRTAEKNFLVSICDNGGREAYRDLIFALEKLVEPANSAQKILDDRVADDERNKLLFTRRFYPAHYPLVIVTILLLTLQYLESGAVENFFVYLAGAQGYAVRKDRRRWFVRRRAWQEA